MLQQNRVTLIGYADTDPRIDATPNGTAVARFRIATARKVSRAGREAGTSVQHHAVVAWGAHATSSEKFVRKGVRMQVEGRLEYRRFEQDGQPLRAAEIVVAGPGGLINVLEPAPKAADGEGAAPGETPAAEGERPTRPANAQSASTETWREPANAERTPAADDGAAGADPEGDGPDAAA